MNAYSETVTAMEEVIRRFEVDLSRKLAFPKPTPLALEVMLIVGTYATYNRPITIDGIGEKTKKPWSQIHLERALKEAALFLGYYGSGIELRRRIQQGERRRLVYWLFVRDGK